MENTSHSNELHWSWLLAAFLLLVVLYIAFGDLLTFIVGSILTITVFAMYYNSRHRNL